MQWVISEDFAEWFKKRDLFDVLQISKGFLIQDIGGIVLPRKYASNFFQLFISFANDHTLSRRLVLISLKENSRSDEKLINKYLDVVITLNSLQVSCSDLNSELDGSWVALVQMHTITIQLKNLTSILNENLSVSHINTSL